MGAKAQPNCTKGHPLTGDNLYLWTSGKTGVTHRHCQTCTKAYRRERYGRQRERLIAYAQEYRKADPMRAKRSERTQHLRRYGVTPQQYDEMLAAQGGACAICHKVCVSGWRLAVDHDHDTGAVRGLLCMKCNRGLGLFCHDGDLMTAAIEYLKAAIA